MLNVLKNVEIFLNGTDSSSLPEVLFGDAASEWNPFF